MTAPITPALKSSARSAYRALFKASGATFAGDDRVLYAFRDKVRTETIAGRREVDPVEYEARVKHAFEVAEVLRKNVVQAVKQGEGEAAAWKLRMTPDIELGSNEGVKAPYSRPARGQPRSKCGDDPNAVSPLPPRSLRHMVDSNQTRSYSTTTLPSSPPTNPDPNPDPNPTGSECEYNQIRVQSVRNRLYEVGRRVSASPTGREFMNERMLLEDKLEALGARMEFLASEIYDRSYSPWSNPAPAQTLANLLLDHLPISPRNTANLVGPPVQLRQHSRFLQNAAKYTRKIRAEALELPSEVRMAIVGLMETPGSRTRDSDHAIENLRALQWRLLMLKRGLQNIVKSGTVSYFTIEPMVEALRLAMRSIGYARECIEDLEINGPRVEDARALLEEIEKSTMGSYLPELRKEMEARLEAGVAWKKVDEAMISHGLSPTVTPTRFIYHRMRQYEDILPGVLATFAKGQEEGDMTHANMYRRKPLVWSQKLLNAIRRHIKIFNIILERLAAFHPQNDEKFELLRDANEALDISMEPTDDYIEMVRGKGKRATWLEWANTVSSRLGLVEELVGRTVMANRYLERYTWGELEVWEIDMEKKDLLFGAKLELVIIYDVAWRLERRMKQDMKDFREASLLLREEVPSEIEASDTTSREPKQFGTTLPHWERELEGQEISSDRGRPKPSRSNAASIARALDSIWILD